MRVLQRQIFGLFAFCRSEFEEHGFDMGAKHMENLARGIGAGKVLFEDKDKGYIYFMEAEDLDTNPKLAIKILTHKHQDVNPDTVPKKASERVAHDG